ncbi:MAG: SRPBCC family protein [Steroidobacteraceae bacterium]|jgi:uncharacterized protein YndB with AHSA1/START domain
MSTDRIEKQILLGATPDRVWSAISDAQKFGTWFGVALDGPFVEGQRLTGVISPTQVDPEVARHQEAFAGKQLELLVERIEPLRRFSFRWHPTALEPDFDRAREPATLVAFELQSLGDGVLLTVSESGFDRLPTARRNRAYAANDAGWGLQTHLIEKYLAQTQ